MSSARKLIHSGTEWTEALINLQKDPNTLSVDELRDLKRMARDWQQCPISDLPDDLPRVKSGIWRGEPTDPEMFELGLKFMKSFLEENFNEAAVIFNRIHVRYKIMGWSGILQVTVRKAGLRIER